MIIRPTLSCNHLSESVDTEYCYDVILHASIANIERRNVILSICFFSRCKKGKDTCYTNRCKQVKRSIQDSARHKLSH